MRDKTQCNEGNAERRRRAGTITAAAVVATMIVAIGASPAQAATSRISGADRYATSAAVAARFASASTVWVATGQDYPDAVSAAPAAAHQGAPLLLTAPPALPSSIAAQLKRLKPARIVIAGGTSAVSATVAKALGSYAKSVVRISGADRYKTSQAIVNYAFGATPTAYAVGGTDWPDALSAGAAAAHVKGPLLLVNGSLAGADSATLSVLAQHKVTAVRIAGGTAVFPSTVQTSLAKKIASVSRVSGADRYATSVAINRGAFAPTAVNAVLASGANFPDALSGVALAGRLGAPLYLSQPTCIASAAGSDLVRLGTSARILIGGTAALSSAVYSGAICADYYTKTYGSFSPRTVSGTGDQAVALPAVKGGYFTARFTGTSAASSWFSVTAKDKNGVSVDATMSGIGASFTGASGWGLAQPATGNPATTLQVRATGSWSLTLYPVSSAPVKPSSGKGYGLYRYDGGAGTWKVTGSSPAGAPLFDVRQYSAPVRINVLVGTSASTYSGSVAHPSGPSVVQVLSNGTWTIK